jgi:hypothetical protein
MSTIKVLPYLKRICMAFVSLQTKKLGKIFKEETTEQQGPSSNSVSANEVQVSEIKKTINGSILTLEGMYQGKPIRVRIFGEPVAEPIPEPK